MTLNPRIWYPIALLGAVLNVVGVAFAARPGEPWWHATLHAGLAVAFGVWAQRLRTRQRDGRLDSGSETEIGELRDDVEALRRELSELQERVDFTERVLSRTREIERLPDRQPGE